MSKTKKQKFYVVWNGRKNGIYYYWEECLKQVEQFECAQYKSFSSLEEAKVAFELGYDKVIGKKTSIIKIESDQKPLIPSICVDAAWNTVTKDMEYQGVDTQTRKLIFRKGPYRFSTNNIGEFLAIVHALALLQKKNSTLPIYTDSNTAIKWVKDKRANTKLVGTPENEMIFDLIKRAENWLKNNNYSNQVIKWKTDLWGEIPADFGRK